MTVIYFNFNILAPLNILMYIIFISLQCALLYISEINTNQTIVNTNVKSLDTSVIHNISKFAKFNYSIFLFYN